MKNVIIYCRESRDDGFYNYERIETQRDLLIAFCEKQSLGKIVRIFMDDNQSGTNFERLSPIKEMVEKKQVDIILCKDASRLGRNILESLSFAEFLQLHKVELVFESEKYDEDMFPLVAWFNERRVKDDSVKIRRVLRYKMEDGSLLIKAPYGYTKNGNKLEINKETAVVVQEIFRLYISGKRMNEIATMMNINGYPTPSQLKTQYENTNQTPVWNKQHISRILNHLIYTGDMPYSMREKLSYKSKKYRAKDRSDWIVFENHHEPVISKEIFEMAQEKIKLHKNLRQHNKNVFCGLLYCGRCGSFLKRKEQAEGKAYFICSKNDKEGGIKENDMQKGCSTHRISEALLLKMIKKYILQIIQDEKYKNIVLSQLNSSNEKSETEKYVKNARCELSKLQKKASIIYEDKLNGMLPVFLFEEKMNVINDEIGRLYKKINEYELVLENVSSKTDLETEYKSVIEKIESMPLSTELIDLLCKKIIVYDKEEITHEEKNHLNIHLADFDFVFENGGIIFVGN